MTRVLSSWRGALFVLTSAAILGTVFFLLDGTMAVLAMVYVAPFIAAFAVSLLPSQRVTNSSTKMAKNLFHSKFILPFFLTAFLLIEVLSLYARHATDERTIVYFGLQGLAIFVVSIQVFACRIDGWLAKSLVLTQIGFLVAFEIALKTIPLPYYTGSTDIIQHEANVRGIVESGHIESFMGNYQFAPAFHVISSAIYLVSSISSYQEAILVFSSIIGYTLPFVFYSVLSRLGTCSRHAMLFALVATQSYVLVADLSAGVPSLLTFLFMLLFLHVSLCGKSVGRIGVVLVIIALTMIMSHQVSIPVYIVVLLTTLVIWGKHSRFGRLELRARLRPALLLAVMYIAYQSGYLLGFYSRIFEGLDLTPDVWIPDTSQVILADDYVRNFVIVYTPFSVLLFLAFLGWLSYAKNQSGYRTNGRNIPILILGALAIATYIPGFLSLIRFIEEYLTIGGRNNLIAEQLVVWFAVLVLHKQHSISALRGRVFLTCIVTVVLLASVMSQANTLDTSATEVLNPRSSTYFTESELMSFSFVNNHAQDLLVLTDFVSSRYIDLNGGSASDPEILYNSGVLFPAGSIVLLRTSELSSSPLNFYAVEDSILVPRFVSVKPVEMSSTLHLSNIIYSSESVDVLILNSDLFLEG